MLVRQFQRFVSKLFSATMLGDTTIDPATQRFEPQEGSRSMRVFLLGATPSFDLDKYSSPKERLQATGGNSGNQIIAYGLLQTFQHSAVTWDYTIGPDRVTAENDVIVVAAANFLFPGFDFGHMADFIEKTKLPVTIVGLGAQSSDTSNPAIQLQPGTQRLVKVVAERAAMIGVRGEYTARVLDHLGVKNVQITGCPSYYLPGKAGYQIRLDEFNDQSPIAIHASRDVFSHSFDADKMKSVVFGLYLEAARRKGIFVAQTEVQEMTLADSKDAAERTVAVDKLMSVFKDAGHPDLMRPWFETNMRVYWSVPDWIDAMRAYPLVIGTRFHGTMAALHAGVPAICICHDSRTTEMCQFLGIPNLPLPQIDDRDLVALRAGADFSGLANRYQILLKEYQSFLTKNGLTSSAAAV